MTDLPPPMPPEPAGPRSRLAHPVALFTVAALVAMALATVVGLAAGATAVAASASNCSPDDGWCGLGAALVGVAAGLAAGGATYIVVGVVAITRHRPSGRRWRHIIAHLLAPIAVVTVVSTLAGTIDALT